VNQEEGGESFANVGVDDSESLALCCSSFPDQLRPGYPGRQSSAD
jgi:hypothetical protein